MVPKSLALSDAPRMVLLLTTPMTVARWILSYPVKILNRIGVSMLKLFRIPPAEGHERVLSAEELELIVTESTEGGLLNVEEQEMILNIFDFSDRTVSQVMTPRTKVQAIPVDVSRQEILKIVSESRHSRFPVYDGDRDHIVGILHLKDLIKQTLRSESRFDLRLILRSAPAVPEDLPVETLLAAFKRQKLHMAIVLDEFGGMDGIVTLEDLVEEVVGEVRDEFDLEKEPFVELGPGLIEAEGEYLVDDFDDGFWGNEDDLPDVETVGGLVISKLGRPPVVGDEVVYNDKIHIRVLAVEGRAVARVLVEFPDPNRTTDEDTAVPPQDNT
jgi:CBS domain containing-hemolysin-like protein